MPDVLDLLVICMEAGLSLDQATSRTAQELHKSHRICATSWELSCWSSVRVALARRRGRSWAIARALSSLRNLVSMLVQTEQFGTSIAKMLRVHADTLRTQRVQMVEEMAAKTSVKLVFPLVLFIFPALFLVTLGPAVIVMMETVQQTNQSLTQRRGE